MESLLTISNLHFPDTIGYACHDTAQLPPSEYTMLSQPSWVSGDKCALAYLCDLDATCTGFSTLAGWLYEGNFTVADAAAIPRRLLLRGADDDDDGNVDDTVCVKKNF